MNNAAPENRYGGFEKVKIIASKTSITPIVIAAILPERKAVRK